MPSPPGVCFPVPCSRRGGQDGARRLVPGCCTPRSAWTVRPHARSAPQRSRACLPWASADSRSATSRERSGTLTLQRGSPRYRAALYPSRSHLGPQEASITLPLPLHGEAGPCICDLRDTAACVSECPLEDVVESGPHRGGAEHRDQNNWSCPGSCRLGDLGKFSPLPARDTRTYRNGGVEPCLPVDSSVRPPLDRQRGMDGGGGVKSRAGAPESLLVETPQSSLQSSRMLPMLTSAPQPGPRSRLGPVRL